MNTKSKVYRKILKHRRKCDKWGKGFCLDCFGGGLTKFFDDYFLEQLREFNKKAKKSKEGER